MKGIKYCANLNNNNTLSCSTHTISNLQVKTAMFGK